MKKVVLVIICSLIMVLFIAFNYLLWDRENKINLEASKNASIDALSREIKTLEDNSNVMRNKINEQDEKIKLLQAANMELEKDRSKLKEAIDQKNNMIFVLKQQIDVKPFEDRIIKWVESIDKGQYETAYNLQLKKLASHEETYTLTGFTNYYKNAISSMKYKSAKLYIEAAPEDKKGDIIFKVVLEVKRAENISRNIFNDGLNERYFTFVFDKEKNDWLISDISQ